MDNHFFERPILNSPYAYPARHWELDKAKVASAFDEMIARAGAVTKIPA